MPNDMISPNWIDIFPDAVLLVTLIPKPIGFVVRSKELALSFKNYFDIVWKNSAK